MQGVRRVLQRTVKPLVTFAVRARLVRGWSLLETTGRRTGLPRRTPVGNGLQGETFWIVAAHGRSAGYVRNIAADPRVRVFVRSRWRSGTAHLLPDDDPRERQRRLPGRLNAAAVRLIGTELLTIRVDLDPE
jgi:deazaflavin-dependent oxidoreductase (nitroreductase family)